MPTENTAAPPSEAKRRTPVWPWLLGGLVLAGFIAVVVIITAVPEAEVWTDYA